MLEKLNKKPCYNIGDTVYSSIEIDSPKGRVLDIQYSFRYNEYKYLVSFGIESSMEVLITEDELSDTKHYNI